MVKNLAIMQNNLLQKGEKSAKIYEHAKMRTAGRVGVSQSGKGRQAPLAIQPGGAGYESILWQDVGATQRILRENVKG